MKVGALRRVCCLSLCNIYVLLMWNTLCIAIVELQLLQCNCCTVIVAVAEANVSEDENPELRWSLMKYLNPALGRAVSAPVSLGLSIFSVIALFFILQMPLEYPSFDQPVPLKHLVKTPYAYSQSQNCLLSSLLLVQPNVTLITSCKRRKTQRITLAPRRPPSANCRGAEEEGGVKRRQGVSRQHSSTSFPLPGLTACNL